MTKVPQADGSIQINLSITSTGRNRGYANQIYIVKPGQSLYFIETNWGEDGPGYDGDLGDDGAILVDANGYAVQ